MPLSVSDATLDAIVRAHARGARIISLCTGAFVLARTGLLDGRRAVTHWDECARFAEDFPNVTLEPGLLYVDEGDILTSAGSAAGIDLCLYVVRCDLGADVATALARQLVVQPHRDGGQAQYIDTPMPSASSAEPIAGALAWMSEHLAEETTQLRPTLRGHHRRHARPMAVAAADPARAAAAGTHRPAYRRRGPSSRPRQRD
jgi:AraC family transcriptional activator FtrA